MDCWWAFKGRDGCVRPISFVRPLASYWCFMCRFSRKLYALSQPDVEVHLIFGTIGPVSFIEKEMIVWPALSGPPWVGPGVVVVVQVDQKAWGARSQPNGEVHLLSLAQMLYLFGSNTQSCFKWGWCALCVCTTHCVGSAQERLWRGWSLSLSMQWGGMSNIMRIK